MIAKYTRLAQKDPYQLVAGSDKQFVKQDRLLRTTANGQLPDDVGGIDLNSANLNFQIKRDGKGVPLPLAQQDKAQLSGLTGFVPVIVEIQPVLTLPLLSQLQEKFRS